MTPTPKSASGATARHDAAEQAQPQGAVGPFVLNLTSSSTPMALSNPEQPELKRFSFFVSRRFEEGRERFRLHMGYFSTLAEAEEWLVAVRDIYPGAWAGEAPGKKLRERAVAAAAAQAQHASGPPPSKASTTPPSRGAPAAALDVPAFNVPTLHAASSGRPAAAQVPQSLPVAKPAPVASQPNTGRPLALNSAPVAKPAPAAARPPVAAPTAAPSLIGMPRTPKAEPAPKAAPVFDATRPVAPTQGRSGAPLSAVPAAAPRPPLAAVAGPAASGAARPAPVAVAAAPRAAQPAKPAAPAANGYQQKAVGQAPAARSAPGAAARPSSKANARAALPNSNVREVLKALDETSSEAEVTGETRMMPAPLLADLDAAADDNNFTDTQVLKFLETRRADGTELPGVDVDTGSISLLKPDDTGTRRALKEAVTDNAPVWFAVQLQWSVQPVELSKVPPLAIFSAYTLYTVEGSRDGRKWYGLRLGFFSDAISAKQVAYYVRSEFASVAVVPVSPQERTRASDVDKKAEMAFPKKTRNEPVDEFKLIDSDERPAPPIARPAVTKPAAPAKSAHPATTARRVAKGNGRVRAREARTPQTLEETLEILGAGELEMDNGNGETMNESGVRHLRVEVQKNTPFSRLLERLSERVRKP
jgi:hypothetical protein